LKDLPKIKISMSHPKKGYQAYYVETKYKDPNGGTFSVCTRVYVTDNEKVL
jgi:PhoPQ-activated pathogenicity-related protein